MFTCTRRLSFDAAHRVLGHQGKCRHLHGHRYDVDVTVYTTKLDGLGMVVDFGVIKEKVGAWMDEYLDHNIILNEADPLLADADKHYGPAPVFMGKSPYVLSENPTAENLAKLIFTLATTVLTENALAVSNVRVYETPNCWADYPGPPMEVVK